MKIFTYENFQKVFLEITESLQFDTIMIAVRTLAISFILLNIIGRWFDSKGGVGKEDKPIHVKELLELFGYMLLIVFQPTLMQFLESLIGSYSKFLMNVGVSMRGTDSLHNFFSTASEGVTIDGAVGWVVSTLCIGILSFIGWIVNATAFPMYMLERGFLLLILDLMMPLVLALAALNKFRDLIWNWIRLYMAIFLMGAFFVLTTVVIDLCFHHFLNILRSRPDSFFDESSGAEALKIGIVAVFVFSKVRLLSASVSISYKLFKV